jgi:hypothetical protein
MLSTGPMPKCSLVGVYNNASVECAVRSAERWAVVKLSRKSISGLIGVQLNSGMATRDAEGAITLYVSEFALASSISVASVVILSCSRGS